MFRTQLLTMSDVYAVLTHSKYLKNQGQNSFHSVKKRSSGNKYMKSDLYIKKALLVTTKKNRFCYKSFQHSAFLNLFDEYSYVFPPNWGTPRPFLWKNIKKKKKKMCWNALETYCYPQLPDTLIWRILPAILILDSETFFFSSVVHRSKSPIKTKIKKLFILEPIQLPLISSSHASAMIFTCWLSKQVTSTSILN